MRRVLSVMLLVFAMLAIPAALLWMQIDTRDSFRDAALGVCVRQDLNRAELHLSAPAVHPGLLLARERRIPIVDCAPTRSGGDPIPLSTHEQRVYVRLYARGSCPVVHDDHVAPGPCRRGAR